jgi:putative membrane protein
MGPQFFWYGGAWIFPLLAFVGMISVLYLFVGLGTRGFFHPFHHAGSDDGRETALAIARKRYAHGEITKAEFEELKKDLTG